MRALVGLDDDLPAPPAPPRPPGHLGHELKGPLVGPKVRKPQELIGTDDAHQPHTLEVQPLGHHLRTHQDIQFPHLELVDELTQGVLAAGGV